MKTSQPLDRENTPSDPAQVSMPARWPALFCAMLIATAGVSCAVAPSSDTGRATRPASAETSATGQLQTAYDSYARRDFAAAASTYDQVVADGSGNAAAQRLAYLGKALVHLSTDPAYRDLDEAGRLLQSAEALGDAGASMETDMLTDALAALVGVEANIAELNAKLSNYSAETARLKREREELQAERATLNEALEKLKDLAIGN